MNKRIIFDSIKGIKGNNKVKDFKDILQDSGVILHDNDNDNNDNDYDNDDDNDFGAKRTPRPHQGFSTPMYENVRLGIPGIPVWAPS